MDHPATPRPTFVLRLSVTLRWPALRWPALRWPSTAGVRRLVATLPRPRPLPALPRPSSATLRRIAALTTKAAIVLILTYAILLVAAAPAYAELAMRSGLWDLASLIEGHRPDVSSPTLTLVVASIVVLAVVSAHSGRGHDRW